MNVFETKLPGVIRLEPRVFTDKRGFFLETFHQQKFSDAGLPTAFAQDNHSHSRKGILRGLHYQLKKPQGKLIYVVQGKILDVAVDIRKGSPTFGQWVSAVLSAENKHQLYIPEGFAHGFYVFSETADVMYKCTDVYNPGDEYGILWNDPNINIDWMADETPTLSEKDAVSSCLKDVPDALLPVYG